MRRLALDFLPWPTANEITQLHRMARMKEKAACMAAFEIQALGQAIEMVSGPSSVEIVIADTHDLDARVKSALDGLQKVKAIKNDGKVCRLGIVRVKPGIIPYPVLYRWAPDQPWDLSEIERWWGSPLQ